MNFAFFISPHGFGHAARACAVMSAIARRYPSAHFDIFTRVPVWFFQQSFDAQVHFEYHELLTDVGFVQASSMVENYGATIDALERLYPLTPELVSDIGTILRERSIRLVLCDISVLGIEAARAVGIPSVLVENFTWDWIYEEYVNVEPRFSRFVQYLGPLYGRASLRVQAEPVCQRFDDLPAVAPIARLRRAKEGAVREALNIDKDAPMVLCTMGGIPGSFSFVPALAARKDVFFVLAGCELFDGLPNNVRAISHRSNFYHPDLMAAADAVVGKVGYSTVAEAYYGRTQFLYIPRPLFAESAVMERFVASELRGRSIEAGSFDDGSWVELVPSILERPAPLSLVGDEGVGRLLELLAGVLT